VILIFFCFSTHGHVSAVQALTDNVNRTAAEVRTAVTKGGGKLADSGSVLFNFTHSGVVLIDAPEQSEDDVLEAALEAGASDIQPATDDDGKFEGFKVLTSLESFAEVRDSLAEQGLKLSMEGSGLSYIPLASVEVNDDDYAANEALFERLMEVNDVDNVYASFL
jgi:transcriptional/translational regulatory protein YebC/TACO1